MIFSERPRFKTPHLGFSESLGRPLAPPSEWKRPGSLSAKHLLPPTCNSPIMLSTPDPSSWSPGLLDPPPETLDLSPMGSSRPGSRGSGALRRRSSGGGPQGGGGGGPSTSLEPGVEQGMPLGMPTSIERRKVNEIF